MSDSRNSPPVQGAMAAQPPNPKYVVDDSPVKAGVVTFMSLLFFGLSLAAAVLRFASAHDLNGIRELMMQQDTINWISAIVTAAAPTIWIGWRTFLSWLRKHRDAEIVEAAPPEIAMTKTQFFEATFAPVEAQIDASAPTRARETTTPATRLVDGSVLLHRGGVVQHGMQPEPQPTFHYDGATGRTKFTGEVSIPRTPPSRPLENMVQVDDLLRDAGIDPAAPFDPVVTRIDTATPEPTPKGNSQSFDQVHERYVVEGSQGAFSDFLREHGWHWNTDTKRWEEKEA